MKSISILILSFVGYLHVSNAQSYILPSLQYSYNSLEPYIDAQTMEIHYTKHHLGYVNNLNKALSGTKAANLSFETLLLGAERRGAAIRNNAGGHYNHSLFWSILSPTAQKMPSGILAEEINATFTSLDSLITLLNNGAATRFGSGWVWLYVTPQKKLAVSSTPNQDNPIMDAAGKERGIPILGIDVWEHAYYLKYQNKRGDYLASIWNVIDWAAVNTNYELAISNPFLKDIEKDSWTALKDFHLVMAQTFHPMEEGNLKPIRERSAEMLSKAKLLSSSMIPVSFQSEAMKQTINKLVLGADKLNKSIEQNGKDDSIKQQLNTLHDIFHDIQGLCSDDH